MTANQYEFGQSEFRALAQKLGLTHRQTLRAVLKVNDIKDFYTWVNAQDFLDIKEKELKKDENHD